MAVSAQEWGEGGGLSAGEAERAMIRIFCIYVLVDVTTYMLPKFDSCSQVFFRIVWFEIMKRIVAWIN